MKDREQWMELCRQASVEQDPEKLLKLTAEIIRLLDEKEDRLIHRADVAQRWELPFHGSA